MAKEKSKAKAKPAKVSNKALYSRISYLYQAAVFLAQEPNNGASTMPSTDKPIDSSLSSSRHLLSDLRAVSLRGQIRVSPAMKHAICKRCNTLLLDDTTCSTTIENKSKGGGKQWADVLVRTCKSCDFQQRIPVGAERQKRRPYRSSDAKVLPMEDKVS